MEDTANNDYQLKRLLNIESLNHQPSTQLIHILESSYIKLYNRKKNNTMENISRLTENKFTNDISIKKKIKNYEKNLFYEELKPLFIMNFVLGRHPYEISDDGSLILKYNSWGALYCVMFYLMQSIITTLTYVQVYNRIYAEDPSTITSETTPGYDNTLYSCLLLNFLHLLFFVPIGNWIVSNKFINVINKWKKFQIMFYNTTKYNFQTKYEKIILYYTILTVVSAIIMDVWESFYLLNDLHWALVLPFIIVTCDCMYFTGIWGFTFLIIGDIAEEIGNYLSEIIEENQNSRSIHKYRALWLELSSLLQVFSSLVQYKFLAFCFVLLVCFVIGCYGFAICIAENGYNRIMAFVFPILFAQVLLFVICDLAHRVTKKVGIKFLDKIYGCTFQKLTAEERFELEALLHVIHLNPPIVKIGGFLNIDRNLYLSIISGITTYLIILVQFKISSVSDT